MGTRVERIGAVIHVGLGGLSTQTSEFQEVPGAWREALAASNPAPRTGGSSLL